MILLDRADPEEMAMLINQSVPCTQTDLNHGRNLGDLFWHDGRNSTHQMCRVQAGELLSDIDSQEDELRRYYDNADHTYLTVEGILSPFKMGSYKMQQGQDDPLNIRDLDNGGGMFSYKVEHSGYIHSGRRFPGIQAPMLYVWFHRLAAAGIPTYFTANWRETARLVVAIYKNERKALEDHGTLQRVITPHLYLKSTVPFIVALVALSQALKLGIGEDRAQKLYDHGYRSVKEILDATPVELTAAPGIGPVTARKLHQILGKEV